MSRRVFHRAISSASYLDFDSHYGNIVFTTRMYNSEKLSYEMREVTIDEEEWLAIVKYGREAGFVDD